ncbi:MAG: hypothetical protein LDL50_07575 [Chloroflexi bacterium]|nr:hypothetical protein [Chloroflexota bacterium]
MKKVSPAPPVFLVILSLLFASCGGGNAPARSPSAEKAPPVLHVAMVKGQVEAREKAGENFAPVQTGQKLGVGAEIRTSEKSAVVLYRDTLSMVALDQNSVMLVKKLAFKSSLPVTVLSLLKGAAVVEHKGKLPKGATLTIETADGRQGGVAGSIVRVSYLPRERRMIVACFSGECSLAKEGQTLRLTGGQEADAADLSSLPKTAGKLSAGQQEEFLEAARRICDCELSLEETLEAGIISFAPPPDEVPTPEEDLEASADENGNTDPESDQIGEDAFLEILSQFAEENSPAENEEPEEGAPPAGDDDESEEPASAPEPAPAEPNDPTGSESVPEQRPEEPPPTGG